MPFEPQHIRARKLTITDKKQITYGTPVAAASMTYPVRMDGSAFASLGKDYWSDLARSGKATPFPTIRQKIAQKTAFQTGLELNDFLPGWMAAFCLGADTISGTGPFTHLFTFLQSTNQMPVTTVYFEETADIKTEYVDMAISDLVFSGTDSGPLTGQFSMVGSGRIVDGAVANPALNTPTMLLGSDSDILIGPQGAPVSIKERVRGWSVHFQVGLTPHRAPGGGMFSTMHKIDQQRATVSLRIAAKDVDDVRTLFLNDTIQELQINTNSGAAAQLKIRFPGMFLSAAQIGVDGNEEIWQVDTDENSVIKSGVLNLVEVTVINNQATYLVAA
jgi:hypothetical protein